MTMLYGVYDANGYCLNVTEDNRFAVYLGAMMHFTTQPWKRYTAPARFFEMEKIGPGHYRKVREIIAERGASQVEGGTQAGQYNAPVPEETGHNLSSAPTAPTYTCAVCGGVFEFGTSEEDAEAEYQALFPASAASGEPRDIVCDVCFQQMNAEQPPEDFERQRYGDSGPTLAMRRAGDTE